MTRAFAVRRARDGSWGVYCVACGGLVQGGFRTRDAAGHGGGGGARGRKPAYQKRGLVPGTMRRHWSVCKVVSYWWFAGAGPAHRLRLRLGQLRLVQRGGQIGLALVDQADRLHGHILVPGMRRLQVLLH
jgi:hypothetical protein